jgi:hypothetical protein
MLPPIARATTISAGISVLAFCTKLLYIQTASGGAVAFILRVPSDSGGPGRGQICLLRVQEKPQMPLCKRFLKHLSVPPSFLQPVSFPAAPSYPVARGSAQMRRKIAPNTRRVR